MTIQPGTLPCPLYIYIGATFNPVLTWTDSQVYFTGSLAASIGTLNVSSVTTGMLQIGQILFGPNIPSETEITSLVTGLGNVGSYGTSYTGTTITANALSAGFPVNLTGYTAALQIRPYASSDVVIADLTTENGGIIIADPTNGMIQLFLSPSQTALLIPQEAIFDLQLTIGEEVDYLIQGQIFIQQMVTQ